MSTSPARLAANAANAALSTGPRTPEGKSRSSHNAAKHGLSARTLVVRDDEREEFEQLRESLETEIQPRGALEQSLFAQFLHAAWNLRRLRRLEAELFENGLDPLLNDTHDAAMTRLARYQGRVERSYYRALRELRQVQTERSVRENFDAAVPEDLPVLASIAEVTKRTQPPTVEEATDLFYRSLEHADDAMLARANHSSREQAP